MIRKSLNSFYLFFRIEIGGDVFYDVVYEII